MRQEVALGPGSALRLVVLSLTAVTLKKPEDKKQLGDFFGMSNSYAECYPAT